MEAKHGVKIKAFERLGGISYAEMKNASVGQFCQMFVDLENDPAVEFVEEDMTWVALGGKPKVEDMLFPPPTLQPEPGSKLHGRMHRRQGVCSSCSARTEGHPNDGDFDELWGMHQATGRMFSACREGCSGDLARCQNDHMLSVVKHFATAPLSALR